MNLYIDYRKCLLIQYFLFEIKGKKVLEMEAFNLKKRHFGVFKM